MNPNKKWKFIALLLGIALLCSTILFITNATTPSTGKYYLSVPTSTWSYMISQFDNGTYYAVNGSNWHIDFQSTNASQIINWACGNLTSGRTWLETIVFKGNFSLDSTVQFYNYTYFDWYAAKFTLADNSNCNMFQSAGPGIHNLKIAGGIIDGNRLNQATGSGIVLTLAGENVEIEDTFIDQVKQDGIYVDGQGSDGISLYNVKVKTCMDYGLHFYHVVDCAVYGGVFWGWDANCYIVWGVSCSFFGTYFGGQTTDTVSATGGANVLIDASRDIWFHGCVIDGGLAHRLRIQKIASGVGTTERISVIGGRIDCDAFDVNNAVPAVAVWNDTQYCLFEGIQFTYVSGNKATYAIEEADEANYNLVLGCRFLSTDYGTGILHLIGVNSTAVHCMGYP
jgi:hypothetical protein